MAGIVSKRHVNAGDVVSPGGELYTIIDPSSMRLEASVPSEQIDAIRIGAPVDLQGPRLSRPDVRGAHRARQPERRSGDAAGADLRDHPQQAAAGWSPGCSPRAGSTREARKTGLVVPLTAVNENGGTPWVVRVRDGKAERVDVTLGLRDEQTERVEIAARRRRPATCCCVGAAQGITPGTPLTGPALQADARSN